MFRADYQDDKTIVEVKSDLAAVRDFRNALLQIIHDLTQYPSKDGYLLLLNPKMGKDSLKNEFHATWNALRPSVARRLHFLTIKNGVLEDGPANVPFPLQELLAKEVELSGRNRILLSRPNMKSEVFRFIILNWITGTGPMTSDWIAKTVGCTYRTVAATLANLGSAVERGSDRSVGLRYFPREHWLEFAATAKRARATILYVDKSDQPRSISSLYQRVMKLNRSDVAIGGAIGAQRHFPDLDLVGAPRLDLCVHAHGTRSVQFPLDRIDPGLEETQDVKQPVRLALHFLRRREPFFTKANDGSLTADPVECLLDLLQSRLRQQSHEFLTYLENQGKTLNARP